MKEEKSTSRPHPLRSMPTSAAMSFKVLAKWILDAVSAAFLGSNPRDMNKSVS